MSSWECCSFWFFSHWRISFSSSIILEYVAFSLLVMLSKDVLLCAQHEVPLKLFQFKVTYRKQLSAGVAWGGTSDNAAARGKRIYPV